jgi:hypothetical protein
MTRRHVTLSTTRSPAARRWGNAALTPGLGRPLANRAPGVAQWVVDSPGQDLLLPPPSEPRGADPRCLYVAAKARMPTNRSADGSGETS